VKTFDAVMMNFIVIGEMVDRLSEEFREGNMQIDGHVSKDSGTW